MHHLESGGTVTKFSAIAGGQKDNKIQLEQKQKDLAHMKERFRAFESSKSRVYKRKIRLKKKEIKRRRDIMIAGRRQAFSWRVPHIKRGLKRAQESMSTIQPCPVDSSVILTLKSPPSVLKISLDWGSLNSDTERHGSFHTDSPWVLKLMSENLDLRKVFPKQEQDHGHDDVLWKSLLDQFLTATTPNELFAVISTIHANVVTSTFDREVIEKMSGCAYIKSGGRVGVRSELVEDMQMSLLFQAKQLRAQENPDEFRASQLEARWEMRYRLDSLGYCWTEEVQEAYETLSKQLHESAHNHLENDHSTLYKIRSIICKRVMEVARKTEKNKRGEGTELRHASLQVDTLLFHPCTKLMSMTMKINANGIG